MFLGRGHHSAKPVAGLHWGWLFIAASAHAAGIYALTQSDIAHRLAANPDPANAAGGLISVSLVIDSREDATAPTATEATHAEPATETFLGAASTPSETRESPQPAPVAAQQEAPVARTHRVETPATEAPAPEPPVHESSPEPPTASRPKAPKEPQPQPVVSRPPATAPKLQVSEETEVASASQTAAVAERTEPTIGEAPAQATGNPLASNVEQRINARFDAAHLRNSPPPYPQASRRRGEEGLVILRVRVGANGRANEIEIAESSGHERLDRAARSAVANWRFEPARDGEDAIESWVRVPVAFRLERS